MPDLETRKGQDEFWGRNPTPREGGSWKWIWFLVLFAWPIPVVIYVAFGAVIGGLFR